MVIKVGQVPFSETVRAFSVTFCGFIFIFVRKVCFMHKHAFHAGLCENLNTGIPSILFSAVLATLSSYNFHIMHILFYCSEYFILRNQQLNYT